MLHSRPQAGPYAALNEHSSTAPQPNLAESIRALRETAASNTFQPPPRSGRVSRRKPVPSPLHHASQTPSGIASDDRSPQSPRSPQYPAVPPSPGLDNPRRSPKERLEAFLSIENVTNSSPTTPTLTPKPSFTAQTVLDSRARQEQPLKSPSHGHLPLSSSPVMTSPSAGPPTPTSPAAMAPPTKPSRPEPQPAAALRTASVDSAGSSASSTGRSMGHSYKSSTDTAGTEPEVASLMKHNAQLWRLVEKQRAMILGLNKDLERALKDKERYRKKLKDLTSGANPSVRTVQNPDVRQSTDSLLSSVAGGAVPDRSSSAASGLLEKADSKPPALPSHLQRASADSQRPTDAVQHLHSEASPPIHPDESASVAGSTLGSPSNHVSPTEHHTDKHGADSLIDIAEKTPLAPPSRPLVLQEVQNEHSSPASLSSQSSPHYAGGQPDPPAVSVTEPTPKVGAAEFPSPPKRTSPHQPHRKAPPAPLDLSHPNRASNHLAQAAPQHEDGPDSDYDDVLEVEELPHFERGRRKTREEDDQLREVMAMKEADSRSVSKKKKKSKSKGGSQASSQQTSPNNQQAATAELPTPTPAPLFGLPSSPRMPPAAHSINALLSPAHSDSSTTAQRNVGSPLTSPGLPTSPRPGDRPMNSPTPRMPKQALASPPLSPKPINNTLPLSPRAPKQPIPIPPTSPLSAASPHLARAEGYQVEQPQQTSLNEMLNASPPAIITPEEKPDPLQSRKGSISDEQVYRGLISEDYPDLLLPPNALPSIDVKVFSSRMRPSRASFIAPKPTEEDPVFILAIYARSDSRQLWRVEKTLAALPMLHQQVRSLCNFDGRLPDRTLFTGHAPAKIDSRRTALNSYFDLLLDTPMDEHAARVVCEFFSADVIGVQPDEWETIKTSPKTGEAESQKDGFTHKEGYLTKRGKNFGGWKARFFVLEGADLRYYETEGGVHLGTIRLYNAQIGKQSAQQPNESPSRRDEDADNQYRHAFLILEPKRKDSSSLVRHVLCAESDEERDAWVEALLKYVDSADAQAKRLAEKASNSNLKKGQESHSRPQSRQRARESPNAEDPNASSLQVVSYEDTIARAPPTRGPPAPPRQQRSGMPSPPMDKGFASERPPPQQQIAHPVISGPSNPSIIQDAGMWGNKAVHVTKEKKRSIFGFRGRSSSDLDVAKASNGYNLFQGPAEPRPAPGRPIFGMPLAEAVECSQPIGTQAYLPAVVYRCLEYLTIKNAVAEEGIFRLSGSNIVIKGLRERFNNEGDVKLLDGQYYDIHAVASLLKLYLRELPASILTRELHLDFLKVLDFDEREKKLSSFNVLVHKLPRANFEIVQAIASYLIEITNNSDKNKMTVRNVGIVFAPTLNIPAPLISMFLTDYPYIFGPPVDESSSPIHEITVNAPALEADAVRSPRHQMFSDLPTPAYSQANFPSSGNPHHSYMAGLPGPRDPRDTGFIPMQPSYEQQLGVPAPAPLSVGPKQHHGGEYGSLNSAMASSQPRASTQNVNQHNLKSRRRESAMLGYGLGHGMHRKSSFQSVREDAAFE